MPAFCVGIADQPTRAATETLNKESGRASASTSCEQIAGRRGLPRCSHQKGTMRDKQRLNGVALFVDAFSIPCNRTSPAFFAGWISHVRIEQPAHSLRRWDTRCAARRSSIFTVQALSA